MGDAAAEISFRRTSVGEPNESVGEPPRLLGLHQVSAKRGRLDTEHCADYATGFGLLVRFEHTKVLKADVSDPGKRVQRSAGSVRARALESQPHAVRLWLRR